MCKKCDEAAQRHYPALSAEERWELLWGATCFPFGGPDMVEKQLIALKQTTDGSLGAALALADEETDAAMRNLKTE